MASRSPHRSNSAGEPQRAATSSQQGQPITVPQQLRKRTTEDSNFVTAGPADHRTTATPQENHRGQQLRHSMASRSPHHSNSAGEPQKAATSSQHGQPITAPQQLRKRTTEDSNFVTAWPADHRTTATPQENHRGQQLRHRHSNSAREPQRTATSSQHGQPITAPQQLRRRTTEDSNFVTAGPADHRTTATPQENHRGQQLRHSRASRSPYHSNSAREPQRTATSSQQGQPITVPQQLRKRTTEDSNFVTAWPADHRTTATPQENHRRQQLRHSMASRSPHHSNSAREPQRTATSSQHGQPITAPQQLRKRTTEDSNFVTDTATPQENHRGQQLRHSMASRSPHHSNSGGEPQRTATLSQQGQPITAPQQLRRRTTEDSNFVTAGPTDHLTTATPQENHRGQQLRHSRVSRSPHHSNSAEEPQRTATSSQHGQPITAPQQLRRRTTEDSNFVTAWPADHRTTATPQENHRGQQLRHSRANRPPHHSNSAGEPQRTATSSQQGQPITAPQQLRRRTTEGSNFVTAWPADHRTTATPQENHRRQQLRHSMASRSPHHSNSAGEPQKAATSSQHGQPITAPQQLRKRTTEDSNFVTDTATPQENHRGQQLRHSMASRSPHHSNSAREPQRTATSSQHGQPITAPQQLRKRTTENSNFVTAWPADHRTTATPQENHRGQQLRHRHSNSAREPQRTATSSQHGQPITAPQQLRRRTTEDSNFVTTGPADHRTTATPQENHRGQQLRHSRASRSPYHSNSAREPQRTATSSQQGQPITVPQQLRKRTTEDSNFVTAWPADHRTTATPQENHRRQQLRHSMASRSPHHSNSAREPQRTATSSQHGQPITAPQQLRKRTTEDSNFVTDTATPQENHRGQQLRHSMASRSPHHSNSGGEPQRTATLSQQGQPITAPQQLRRRTTEDSNFVTAGPTDHLTTATPQENHRGQQLRHSRVSRSPHHSNSAEEPQRTATSSQHGQLITAPQQLRRRTTEDSNFVTAWPADHRTTATPQENHRGQQLRHSRANRPPHHSNSAGEPQRTATSSQQGQPITAPQQLRRRTTEGSNFVTAWPADHRTTATPQENHRRQQLRHSMASRSPHHSNSAGEPQKAATSSQHGQPITAPQQLRKRTTEDSNFVTDTATPQENHRGQQLRHSMASRSPHHSNSAREPQRTATSSQHGQPITAPQQLRKRTTENSNFVTAWPADHRTTATPQENHRGQQLRHSMAS
ncbi:hypothetical protein Aduo_007367 [Ancylostoma duodenale]